MSQTTHTGVSGRRSEDRVVPGQQQRQDSSSVADGPFSPAGLKVLVVDDDPMCLKVVSAMLKRCNYEVSTKSNGQEALAELRQRQEEGTQFDLVLSDVYMPDMDGFKLLENIGLELELPVIMMSSDSDTSVVLRGVTHGAVDFLIKPVRIEELRNVWQHVIRRRSCQLSRGTTAEESGADQDGDSRVQGTKRSKEIEVLRAETEGGTGGKKARVVWSVEMHQQFVYAVNTLGIDKAVPKRILDLMNVEGLTRENVASHLQKYRLYLKRVEGVTGKNNGSHQKSSPVSSAKNGKNAGQSKSSKGGRASSEPINPREENKELQRPVPASGSNHNLTAMASNSPSNWPGNSPNTMYQASHPGMFAAAGNMMPGQMAWQPNMMAVSGSGYAPMAGGGYYHPIPMTSMPPMYQHQHAAIPSSNGAGSATLGSLTGSVSSLVNKDTALHGNIREGSLPQDPSITGDAHTNGHTAMTSTTPNVESEILGTNGNIMDDLLPNIECLRKESKTSDMDSDLLDMFIKGMEEGTE